MSNDSPGNVTAEQYVNYEGRAVKGLVEKCGDRYHALISKNRDGMQVRELLEKTRKMVKGNEDFCIFCTVVYLFYAVIFFLVCKESIHEII